jgi:large subunit ribosomal protein L9
MKVILIRDVVSLGKEGDLVEVSDGHACNFLFPQNLAVQATADVVQKRKQKEEAFKRQTHKEVSVAGEVAKSIDGQEIILKEKVSDGGVLYASVTSKDIAKVLSKAGFNVKADMVKLDAPIKEPGEYHVQVEFKHGFEAEIKVLIEEKT